MATEITAPITIHQTSIGSEVQVQQPEIAAPVGIAEAKLLLNLDGGTPTSVYGGLDPIDGGTA